MNWIPPALQSLDLPGMLVQLAGRAPGFAARLAAAGLDPAAIETIADLTALPVIRKDDLSELQSQSPPFAGFLACAPGDLKRIYQSPGPIYEPEAPISDYWRWAEALRAAGFQPGELVINCFGYHLTPAGAMFEEGLRAIGCVVIPGGVGNLEQQVQAIATLGVSGFVGLPSYLKALIEKAAEINFALPIQRAFLTAEPLPASLREFIDQHGIDHRQGYGTAECGNLGFECQARDGWHLPADAFVQVCDINHGKPLPDGEVGEIVATLVNRHYALVRFGTGDLSALQSENCSCGRRSPRLMGWQGRVGDATKVRGMFLHPRQIQQMMGRFEQVLRWQAIIRRVDNKDFLTLRIVLKPGAADADLTEQLKAAARESIKFLPEVERVDPQAIDPQTPWVNDTRTWE